MCLGVLPYFLKIPVSANNITLVIYLKFYLSFVLRLDEQQPISGGVCVFF